VKVDDMSHNAQKMASLVAELVAESPAVQLHEIATALGVSCRTLRRAIRNELGMSFRGLQTQALVACVEAWRAKDTTLLVKELAYTLGFNDPRSFSRRVKAATGLSPTQLAHSASEGCELGRVSATTSTSA
jgi:AraC-like DNA-binding protein